MAIINNFNFEAGYAKYKQKRVPKTIKELKDKNRVFLSLINELVNLILEDTQRKMADDYVIPDNEPVLPELFWLPIDKCVSKFGWTIYDGGWLNFSYFLTISGERYKYMKNIFGHARKTKFMYEEPISDNQGDVDEKLRESKDFLSELCKFAAGHFSIYVDTITKIGKDYGIEILFHNGYVFIS